MAISTTTVAQTTPAAIYTSVNNTAITWATFTNFSGATAYLTLYLVPNGGSAANSNMIADVIELSENETFNLYSAGEKLILGNGDAIHAFTDTATSVNAVVSYTSI